MSDLLQWLTSYLNVSKLTALTVPGMLAAVALLLVFGPIPCNDNSWSANLKPSSPKPTSDLKNTVTVSSATWSTPLAQQPSVLQSFIQLFPNSPSLQQDLSSQVTLVTNGCKDVPLYVVAGSRPGKSAGASEPTHSGLYPGEQNEDVTNVLPTLNKCYLSLTAADSDIQKQKSTFDAMTAQDTADFNGLSTELVNAQKNANKLEEGEIKSNIAQAHQKLEHDSELKALLSQADVALTGMLGQVGNMRGVVNSIVGGQAAPPSTPAPAATAAAKDILSVISQNFIKFLVFSLILGVILDPIQRGLVSFVGPRRGLFELFNAVYGSKGDGEIRFGDRRLAPWTNKSGGVAAKSERPSWATYVFEKDENIYDPAYAIGAGFITQSELNTLYNDFYRQSQITTGLIVPVLLLAACIGVRLYNCNVFALQQAQAATTHDAGDSHDHAADKRTAPPAKPANAGAPATEVTKPLCNPSAMAIIGLICLGFCIATGLCLLLTASGSGSFVWHALKPFREPVERSSGFLGFRQMIESQDNTELSPIPRGIVLMLLALVSVAAFGALWWIWFAHTEQTDWVPWIWIGGLCSLPLPLWMGGMDRLHKFYSDLQARIAGDIRKDHENTEQKVIDLLTDQVSRKNFMQRLSQEQSNEQAINEILQAMENTAKKTSSTPDQNS